MGCRAPGRFGTCTQNVFQCDTDSHYPVHSDTLRVLYDSKPISRVIVLSLLGAFPLHASPFSYLSNLIHFSCQDYVRAVLSLLVHVSLAKLPLTLCETLTNTPKPSLIPNRLRASVHCARNALIHPILVTKWSRLCQHHVSRLPRLAQLRRPLPPPAHPSRLSLPCTANSKILVSANTSLSNHWGCQAHSVTMAAPNLRTASGLALNFIHPARAKMMAL